MTSPTTKPVKRITVEADRDRGRQRRIVISIGPGDVVGFRYERMRSTFTITARAAMQHAQRLHADAERRRKADERQARRAGSGS